VDRAPTRWLLNLLLLAQLVAQRAALDRREHLCPKLKVDWHYW
jgi:hypothetical protein